MKFPRKLNKIYKFQKDDKWYIADLDNQVLLEASEIIVVILDLCENHNNLSIISKLREMYTSEVLRSAFQQMEQFSELGFLFNHGNSEIIQNFPTKIFVPFREYASVFTQFTNARLLEALSKLCQVIVQVPEDRSEADFQLENGVNIEYVKFSRNDTLHWILQVPPDSGILLLNSRTDTDALLYQHLDNPIIQYARSAELASKNALDNVLKSYNLMMPKDRLIVDSIWLPIWLEKQGISSENLDFVPPGSCLNISPEEHVKKEARTVVNSLLSKHYEVTTKVILITSPFHISRIWEFAHKISYLIPDSQIVLIGPSDNVSYSEKVSVISLNTVDDLKMLSLILQACDVSLTIGAPGAEASILAESSVANIPSLLVTQENSHNVFERLNLNVVELPTIDTRYLLSNVRLIADQVNQLLHEGSSATANFASHAPGNWEKYASDIYCLFEQNHQVISRHANFSWYGPTVFSMNFNPYKKSLVPCIYELPHLNATPFTEGFGKALRVWHTEKEVELVLNSIETQLEKVEENKNKTE